MTNRTYALLASASLLLSWGCVSGVHVAGAPCPCPDDHVCCETLASCVSNSSQCPDEFPPSSALACSRDTDCRQGEHCYAWSSEDQEILGPGECRVLCETEHPCAEGEVCELALHDGIEMSQMNTARLCLPETPIAGCEDRRCDGCGDLEPGAVYCDQTRITGCFFTLHPICGLACHSSQLQECAPGVCDPSGDTPVCDPAPGVDGEMCDWFDCSICEGSYGDNGTGCEVDTVVTCWRVPSNDPDCEEFCWQTFDLCPEGTTCDDEGGPLCVDLP